MKKILLILVISMTVLLFLGCPPSKRSTPPDKLPTLEELPDNYLIFTMDRKNERFEGQSEHLEGFQISMDVSSGLLKKDLNKIDLISLVKNQEITGILTYPTGRTTDIKYEVVRYRETEDIYMKTTLGYFLWEYAAVESNEIAFIINWWYCPPAQKADLDILDLAEQLLSDPSNWHKNDDRKCDDDIKSNKWSLFCALQHASMEKMGEYNHHNTAMQTVRFVIDDLILDHGFEHTLMDFNNAPSTTHKDIVNVLQMAEERISKELNDPNNEIRPSL